MFGGRISLIRAQRSLFFYFLYNNPVRAVLLDHDSTITSYDMIRNKYVRWSLYSQISKCWEFQVFENPSLVAVHMLSENRHCDFTSAKRDAYIFRTAVFQSNDKKNGADYWDTSDQQREFLFKKTLANHSPVMPRRTRDVFMESRWHNFTWLRNEITNALKKNWRCIWWSVSKYNFYPIEWH